ncbi:MAG: sulfur oxidation protein SoxZ [Sulfuricurvum sp. PC08-66]|nr:MAG: sulfur oxidation protein SoxZ [Sulfuricurvum sp. PC08-66]
MATKALIKIKPKKYAVGEIVKIDFMVMHPMETGLRKDKAGALIPAEYINDVKFFFNDKLVTHMEVWESLSTNPLFSTSYKIAGAGEFKVIFTDNKGGVNEQSTKITPKG